MKRMRWCISCMPVVLACGILHGQQQVTWQRTYGGEVNDYGSNILQIQDGGYAWAIWSKSANRSDFDFEFWRLDANGDTLWTRRFGGPLEDYIEGFYETKDGGFMLSGYTSSFGATELDYMLIALDGNGETQWRKLSGWERTDGCLDIAPASDGGFFLAGASNLRYPGDYDGFILRIDSLGNEKWCSHFGLSQYDEFSGIAATPDNGCVATGYSGEMTVLVKADSLGDFEWTRSYSMKPYSFGWSVSVLDDGGYVITGAGGPEPESLADEYDIFVARIKPNGVTQWGKIFGGPRFDQAFRVRPVPDGGFVVVGTSASGGHGGRDIYLFKVNERGRLLWERWFGGPYDDEAADFSLTSDGGFIISGTRHPSEAHQNAQAFLIKTDSLGREPTAVREEAPVLPLVPALLQNFPNPFNQATTIHFECPTAGEVSIGVCDLQGRLIRILADGPRASGHHRVSWDGIDAGNRPVPSGVYFCRMTSEGNIQTIKLVMVR